MNVIRKLLCWLFAISSLLCLWNGFQLILRFAHRQYIASSLHNLLIASLFPALAILYAIAWWTVWKKRPSGRVWGAIACLTYVVLPIWNIIAFRSLPLSLGVMLLVGILALVILLWPVREEPEESPEDTLSPD
jgi:hypothetical protein